MYINFFFINLVYNIILLMSRTKSSEKGKYDDEWWDDKKDNVIKLTGLL